MLRVSFEFVRKRWFVIFLTPFVHLLGRSRAAGEIIIEPNGIQKYRGAASFNEFSADGFFILSASGDVIAIGGTTDGTCALEEDPQSCNDKDGCEWLSIFNEKNGMCLLMLPE